MRSLNKYGTMAAAVALLAASGTVAQAADVDLQSLQQQINQLQQQLKDMQAKQAAAPAPAAVDPGAAKIPANGGPGFLQYGSDAGGFVIPGTKTALKVGGNANVQFQWDVDAGAGSAGSDNYQIRSGANGATSAAGSSGFALPGTPYARQTGHFSASAGYSRLYISTRTPSEYGEIKFYAEGDFNGSQGNEYNSNSHGVRLRHFYGTLGNWTVGQTWSLWSDRATLGSSVLNSGAAGPESGVRQALAQYRWDIDPAQKNQLYFSVENSFSDFYGNVAATDTLGANPNNPTTFNRKYPDVLARYAYNDSWGRAFVTGMVRDLNIDTLDSNVPTGMKYTGRASDSTIGWGVTTGAKVYTSLGDPKNAVFARLQAGQGIGRYMNFNNISQNTSAVLDTNGHLKSIYSAGYQVAYQHFFTPSHTWQGNVLWSDQKTWQKNSLMAATCGSTAGAVFGDCGLPLRYQQIELNVMWSPNSYLSTGPAYTRANVEVAKGLNLVGVTGATRSTSGTTAVDNRFIWTTNVGF